jgi:predicted DCC family thiol-disulfide oxidoreductase YuxK
MNPIKYPLVLFDSECTLCTRFSQALDRLDGENILNQVSLHEAWLYEEFSSLNKDECKENLHVLLSHEKALVGARAIEFLITKLPGVKSIAWLIESKNGKKALDFFYSHVNKIRHNKKICPKCNGAAK